MFITTDSIHFNIILEFRTFTMLVIIDRIFRNVYDLSPFRMSPTTFRVSLVNIIKR